MKMDLNFRVATPEDIVVDRVAKAIRAASAGVDFHKMARAALQETYTALKEQQAHEVR